MTGRETGCSRSVQNGTKAHSVDAGLASGTHAHLGFPGSLRCEPYHKIKAIATHGPDLTKKGFRVSQLARATNLGKASCLGQCQALIAGCHFQSVSQSL